MLKFVFLLCYMFFTPTVCWAMQPHGGLEGLISHEAGHILFSVGILFIFFHGRENSWLESGWQKFKYFLFLLILWNALTFIGHCLDLKQDNIHFLLSAGQRSGLAIDSGLDLLYYFSKLDHFILAPAMIFLVLALRSWLKSVEADI